MSCWRLARASASRALRSSRRRWRLPCSAFQRDGLRACLISRWPNQLRRHFRYASRLASGLSFSAAAAAPAVSAAAAAVSSVALSTVTPAVCWPRALPCGAVAVPQHHHAGICVAGIRVPNRRIACRFVMAVAAPRVTLVTFQYNAAVPASVSTHGHPSSTAMRTAKAAIVQAARMSSGSCDHACIASPVTAVHSRCRPYVQ